MDNQAVFKEQLDKQKHQPVKMLVIKKFNKNQLKLKGFLMQIKIKINNEGLRLATLFNKVIYAGMHLIGKPFK